MLKELEREKKRVVGEEGNTGWRVRPSCNLVFPPGHSAPGLLYPPPAINHLILSLLNRYAAGPHPLPHPN